MKRIVALLIRALSVAWVYVLIPGFFLADAQIGPQLLITMNLAGSVKPDGGEYFIAFTVDNTILLGPRSDSNYWTHYVLYRGGRFFFGRVPLRPYRPFDFLTIRPPQPYLFGQALPDGRSFQVSVALSDLGVTLGSATRIKVNFVTVDQYLKPLDALGRGSGDPFGFITIDLSRDTYVTITHQAQNCPDPGFCITGGGIRVTTP